ncbi:hypothetical protein CROQUDRAFT_101673 [Cronartium quercuum f. sp. fusiforme G11]|uniref:Uncharacterized protein n=1 Tax=Cronartium quercuum f. sp. fusiforme G11 TaxID=708437 RepID=A0A9P6T5B9_9BASI|nr:hypothetical protein CROQUDRAFT_101673 [Cronartium quercuum f. sp. fusiforme G11]
MKSGPIESMNCRLDYSTAFKVSTVPVLRLLTVRRSRKYDSSRIYLPEGVVLTSPAMYAELLSVTRVTSASLIPLTLVRVSKVLILLDNELSDTVYPTPRQPLG